MSTKLHLVVTSDGHVVDGFLSGGNRNDIAAAEELTEGVYGCYVVEDRGYDSNKNRIQLESQGNIPVIPGRKNRKVKIEYDKEKYKLRGFIERIFGKLKENRRLALRYEKNDLHFLSFIACAFIKSNLC
jgi:IS5 family transposase